MYLVALAGNPNVPSQEILKTLVVCYGKNFFKKFPKALESLKAETLRLSQGNIAHLPMSEDCWGRLGKINRALIDKNKAVPLRIVKGSDLVHTEGDVLFSVEKLSMSWVRDSYNYHVEALRDGSPLISTSVRLQEDPETIWDILEGLPFFWKIAFYDKFRESNKVWKKLPAELAYDIWEEV